MTERRKRPVHPKGVTPKRVVPPDERDFELAREIDMRKASPMSAMTKMDNSMFANVIHQGMVRKPKHEEKDPNAIPMPTRIGTMFVHRRKLPKPVEKSKAESDAEKRVKVLVKQLEINERERDELKQTVDKLKKAIIELKNKPTEIQKLLDLFHYDSVEELQNDIIKYRVAQKKARKRKERFEKRHGYA